MQPGPGGWGRGQLGPVQRVDRLRSEDVIEKPCSVMRHRRGGRGWISMFSVGILTKCHTVQSCATVWGERAQEYSPTRCVLFRDPLVTHSADLFC